MAETVVLVPGIGFGGIEFLVLARYLRKAGYRAQIFWYNPWRKSLAASAKALHQMLTSQPVEMPHLVAHSLGGLVTLQMQQDFPQQNVGRIVLLGTPLHGCLAARRILRVPGGRWLLGDALASVCTQSNLSIPPGLQVGSLAGRCNFLLGLFLCPHQANDTLICVEETQQPDLSDHRVLFVSHTSMLLSKQASAHITGFLHNGIFCSLTATSRGKAS